MQKFKTVVQPKNKLLDLKLKETFSYRDLIFLFVKRDFVSRYKQTILGPLWVIIQPLLTTLINFLIFGVIADLVGYDVDPTKAVPSYLFIMCGSACWSYISTTVTAISNTFITNANIMGKVYYPRLVSPISTTISNLINLAIQMLIFIVVAIIFALTGDNSIAFTPWMLMLPVTVIQMMLISLGVGLFISAFTTKYRDLTMFVGFIVSLACYVSPVNYGLYVINGFKDWVQILYMINPFTNIVLTFKYSIFGTGYFHIGWYMLGWAFTILFLFLGTILFNKTERTFMDTI